MDKCHACELREECSIGSATIAKDGAADAEKILRAILNNKKVCIFGREGNVDGRYEVLFTGPEEVMKSFLDKL